MGLFSRKKKNDFFQVTQDTEVVAKGDDAVSPAHVLTKDEILSDFSSFPKAEEKSDSSSDGVSPLEATRQRMLENMTAKKQGSTKRAEGVKTESAPKQESYKEDTAKKENTSSVDFMSLFEEASPKEVSDTKTVQGEISPDESLLKRCMPYIVDEQGRDVSVSNEPIYQLQSVADILRANSERDLEELKSKYEVTFDDLGRKPKQEIPPKKEEETVKEAVKAEEKVVLPPETKSEPETKSVDDLPPIEDIFLEDDEILIFDDELPQISDIDNRTAPIVKEDKKGDTATIRFTPVRDGGADSEHISVSTATRAIDLTGEFGELSLEQPVEVEQTQLEESEFESFEAKENINNSNDGKRMLRKFAILMRRSFLQTVFSAIILAVMLLFLLPSLSNFLITSAGEGMTICTVLLFLALVINFDMFGCVKTLFSRRSSTDSPAMLCSVVMLSLGVTASIKRENVYEILLLGVIILFIRALSSFRKRSALLGNLKQSLNNRPKKAVSLITDEATTFAMSKSAIEGDALIAAARTTDSVDDFMKYSGYATVLNGRMRLVTISACALSVILALSAGAVFSSVVAAFYSAAVIMTVAAAPVLFELDSLPLYCAASRLNKKGAFIAGIAGANRLEMANAAVLSSKEIFPDGTVTLHDMKVLSDNDFDRTIMRAASLTQAVGSPLEAIFKKIAGTNSNYTIPDSDTVKYEDKLGLSGWVDDELLFIGNRTLMQAHGIAVPDVEVDRRILRRGYFPVYLASGGKACALIIVQYNVDPQVVYELKRITGLGVTLLVNNCDPNITEEMICDYIGLYDDSVKIMSNSGVHMYKNAVIPCEHCSAPAAYRGNPLNFISVLNCASRIKRSTKFLSIFYMIAACFGVVLFAYLSFLGGENAPVSGLSVLLTQLASMVVSYLIFWLWKP
ncbi:MAG: hypothetical protein E7562_01040 [Ruminococcaceae bacterium]|nr:hypothetical protein [Oscillospiraceae bacterium]